jgi:YidC/Oxa1 family membrane protein insertase
MNNKFDLNTLIGFLLIGGILLYFGYFTGESTPEQTSNTEQTLTDSTTVEEDTALAAHSSASEEITTEKDTTFLAADTMPNQAKYGPFARAAFMAKADTFTLENENIKLSIASLGGQIIEARLKNYRTYDSLPLYLIKNNANFNLALVDGKRYYTADLPFTVAKKTDDKLILQASGSEGQKIIYTYFLPKDSYQLQWNVSSENMATLFPGGKTQLTWELKANRHEKNRENELTMTEIEYRYTNDDEVDELNGSGTEEEKIAEPLSWLAYKQQFFSTILHLENGSFNGTNLLHKVTENEENTKYFAAATQIDVSSNGNLNSDFELYLGPNKYDLLASYNQEYEQLIPLGWGIFGWINRGFVINIFNWLEQYGINYGIIILIIALIFKLILFPLTYTSYRSMAKMRVLKPEIDELNEKYKDKDAMEKQQATMKLYQKAGVNPLGGCLPMVLQMPILIALFRFFPASIELRQQSFLWADDLSSYDSILSLPFEIPFYGDHVSLFTLLMTVSTLIYTYMNQQLTGSAQNQQLPQMKYIIYFMPIIFLGVFNSYAAGLSYYYFVANMITFGQQFAIKSFINEDKIHAKIQEKKNKPKKENSLMRRMKEMQEQQNRQMRRRNK